MIRAYTKAETIEIMIAETKNELMKCEVMDQLFQRHMLKGKKPPAEMMGMNQHKISQFKETLIDLEDILKTELAKTPPKV